LSLLKHILHVINPDLSGLYLVHISGLWGSPSLPHNHCLTSYTLLPSAADHHTQLHSAYTYCPCKIRTGSEKHINKKRKRKKVPPYYAGVTSTCTVLPTRKRQLKHH